MRCRERHAGLGRRAGVLFLCGPGMAPRFPPLPVSRAGRRAFPLKALRIRMLSARAGRGNPLFLAPAWVPCSLPGPFPLVAFEPTGRAAVKY